MIKRRVVSCDSHILLNLYKTQSVHTLSTVHRRGLLSIRRTNSFLKRFNIVLSFMRLFPELRKLVYHDRLWHADSAYGHLRSTVASELICCVQTEGRIVHHILAGFL